MSSFKNGQDVAGPVSSVIRPGSESVIDVDRAVRPKYPYWVNEPLYPSFESNGPDEYDVEKVEHWYHDNQKIHGWVDGNTIHTDLLYNMDLCNHFGLRPLEEIQKKGLVFYRKYFRGLFVFGWAGAVMDNNDDIRIPFLYENEDEVLLRWRCLYYSWCRNYPALRYEYRLR